MKHGKRRQSYEDTRTNKRVCIDPNCKPSRRSRKQESKPFHFKTRLEQLATVYESTSTLKEFLSKIDAFNERNWEKDVSKELGVFLDQVLVGIANVKETRLFLQSSMAAVLNEQDLSQADIIKCVIEDQFKRPKRVEHVLTHGFELTRASSNFGNDFEMHYFNSQVNELTAPLWMELRTKTTPATIYLLLSKVALFKPLSNNSVFQITGISFNEIRKTNKAQEKPCTTALNYSIKRASQVSIKKISIVYANPCIYSAEKKVRYGLFPQHHLNAHLSCLNENTSKEAVMNARVKCTLTFMFPIQHKLPSPLSFDPTTTFDGKPAKDQFNLRKLGIFQENFTKSRVPKCLSGVTFEMARRLIRNNQECSYRALLDKFCPNTLEKASQVISQRLSSQMIENIGNNTDDMLAIDDTTFVKSTPMSLVNLVPMSQAEWNEVKKVDLSSSPKDVFMFCRAAIQKVVPAELIGSKQNWKLLFKCVEKFINLRRYEDLRVSYLVDGMSFPDIWNKKSGGSGKAHFFKCKELQLEFIHWLFENFLGPLLRSHFYVTEISGGGNKLVYFRHDVWSAVTYPAFEEFCNSSLEIVPRSRVRDIVGKSMVGVPSAFRLIPKVGGGYRGIACLGRSREKTEFNLCAGKTINVTIPSVNRVLQHLFKAASFEHWKKKKSLLGGTIMSIQQLHGRLLDFKQLITNKQSAPVPKLYFVKVDVKKCYDTIPAEKALELAKVLLADVSTKKFKSYFMHKFQKISCAKNPEKMRVRYTKVSEYLTSTKTGFETAQALAGKSEIPTAQKALAPTMKVIIDQANGSVQDGAKLAALLEEHLLQNLIKVGKKVYRQKVGIPQGSVLSTLLCNIVYAELERDIFHGLGENMQKPPYLLVRFVDDFLFISPDRGFAEYFLSRMAQGFPEYGAVIHKDKTLTNFTPRRTNERYPTPGATNFREVQTLVATHVGTNEPSWIMPYIGVGIDTRTLELVRLGSSGSSNKNKNINRTGYGKLVDAVSIGSHGASALAAFRESTLRAVKTKLPRALVDLRLNSRTTVLRSVASLANEMARRILLGSALGLRTPYRRRRFASSEIVSLLRKVIDYIAERSCLYNHDFVPPRWDQDVINTAAMAMIKVFHNTQRQKFAPCIVYLESLCSGEKDFKKETSHEKINTVNEKTKHV